MQIEAARTRGPLEGATRSDPTQHGSDGGAREYNDGEVETTSEQTRGTHAIEKMPCVHGGFMRTNGTIMKGWCLLHQPHTQASKPNNKSKEPILNKMNETPSIFMEIKRKSLCKGKNNQSLLSGY